MYFECYCLHIGVPLSGVTQVGAISGSSKAGQLVCTNGVNEVVG